MSKVYYKKQRLFYGFGWMFIFALASFLTYRFLEITWLATILMIFSGLSLFTGLFGKNNDFQNPIGLACPKCKILEPILNINSNPDSTIFMYGEHYYRTREEDGLNIYPFLCLKCKTVTEFASDHSNTSGHAICGQEYFDSRNMTKTDLSNALNYAKEINANHILHKLKSVSKNIKK